MKQAQPNKTRIFFPLWLQLRKAINALILQENSLIHLKIILFLTFIFASQFLAYFWLANSWSTVTKILDKSSYIELASFLIILFGTLVVIINLATLILHFFIYMIGGFGKFVHTKSAVYWSSVTTIPIGLTFLLFIWSGEANIKSVKQSPDFPLFTFCLQCMAALAFIIFTLYTLIILSRMLSEIHRISSGRAFVAVVAGTITTFILGPIILKTAINIFA
ncbi:MAG: YIP1 family protein [Parachlamydia sp.]|nr:YIP1 family protein [Parachlamydia sp.]